MGQRRGDEEEESRTLEVADTYALVKDEALIFVLSGPGSIADNAGESRLIRLASFAPLVIAMYENLS